MTSTRRSDIGLRIIRALEPNGEETSVLVEMGTSPVSIKIKMYDSYYEYTGGSYFQLLKSFRREADSKGIKLGCHGACINVYPSRMTTQMSNGLLAYKLRLNRPTSDEDIVDIFEQADFDLVGTVEEQEGFYNDWISSFRNQ